MGNTALVISGIMTIKQIYRHTNATNTWVFKAIVFFSVFICNFFFLLWKMLSKLCLLSEYRLLNSKSIPSCCSLQGSTHQLIHVQFCCRLFSSVSLPETILTLILLIWGPAEGRNSSSAPLRLQSSHLKFESGPSGKKKMFCFCYFVPNFLNCKPGHT